MASRIAWVRAAVALMAAVTPSWRKMRVFSGLETMHSAACTVLVWVLAIIVYAVPYVAAGLLTPMQAVFESTSGLRSFPIRCQEPRSDRSEPPSSPPSSSGSMFSSSSGSRWSGGSLLSLLGSWHRIGKDRR